MCAFVVSLCLTGSTVPALAETVGFDITVPGDILSLRTAKADSEQRFYVTGTMFSKTVTLYRVLRGKQDEKKEVVLFSVMYKCHLYRM